jgi:hypothetical protein
VFNEGVVEEKGEIYNVSFFVGLTQAGIETTEPHLE